MTSARRRAAAVIGAALVPAPSRVAVSWFAGERASRPERVEGLDGAPYDLATLADDLRVMVRTVKPKGDGVALCPAVFGAVDLDGPDLDAPRRIGQLRGASLVQLDVDAGATMREVVAMLGAWGVAAVVWPSPSAVAAGLDAERVRAMIQTAPDVPRVEGRERRIAPSSYAARRALVRLARWCLPGARVDEGPAGATALAFVHPRHAPRPASDVVLLRGRAVDLDTLAAVAVTAGVVPAFDASADRHRDGAAYDLDALRELAAAAGLAVHRGGRVAAVECPRAAEHSHGGRGERGDTSCAIGPWREPWRCEHSHGGEGKLGAAALVRLALAMVRDPATRERLDAALHGAEGPVERVRHQLAAVEVDAGVSRVIAPDVDAFMREVGRDLRREHERAGRAAAIVRASPGAGKSRGLPALVDACAPPPAAHERGDGGDTPREPLPVAVVLTDQRDRFPALAAAFLAPVSGPRRLPLVHTPVSRVMAPDGLPECTFERATGAASRVERAGGSARTLLCILGKCPRAADHSCSARAPLVPHDGTGPRPSLAAELGADAPRVVIATHAAPSFPREGGVVVVDEAHAAPWSALEVNDRDPEPLTHAARLARWQRGEGTADATALVCMALAATPQALREVEAAARLAWCTDRVMEASAVTLRRIHRALDGAEAPEDTRGRVVRALDAWRGGDGFDLLSERRTSLGRVLSWRDGTAPVADDAGEALRAVRAWMNGAPVVAVKGEGSEGGEAVASRVSWDAPATVAARAWFARGGIVAHLDATADAAVAAAMFGDASLRCDLAEHRRALDAAQLAAVKARGAAVEARALVTPAGRRRRARAALVPPGIPGPRVVGPAEKAERAAATAARFVEVLGAFAPRVEGGPVAPRVFSAELPDRREVARVVIADTRATSRSQFTARRGAVAPAVRWDRIGAQLGAVAARVAAWRGGRPGPVEGAGLARQPIARALAALWALDAAGGDVDAAAALACVDLRPGRLTRGDVARELRALSAEPRAVARAAELRALAPSWVWTYPGHPRARGSNDLDGRAVFVSLGDFRATPAEAVAVADRTERSAEHEAARLAGDVAVQWFGRARVVREGPPVLMIHVGELPPPDWRGVAVEVVGARDAAAVTSSAEVASSAPASEGAPVDASPAAAVDTPAARALAALTAAGWTPGGIARQLAASLARPTESIARTLRRWREGGEARDPALLGAVVDLAREARDPADSLRARVVYLARGRGHARVWFGAGGAVGLRVFADRFGVDVRAVDLEAFAGGADRPEVVALLLRDVGPGIAVLAALEAAHGIAPPPPLDASSTPDARARVAAEGRVEGSEWSRPDALRLRPGVARPPASRPAPAPIAPPVQALPGPAASRSKGAPQ